ncbi:unnamed protein product [Durusdinium trenchii]|uniref:Secreted protein n=1 Tax=Durusdinium trenchii TaxID=1381693 RepID=A0ABP0SEN4_9DINO
MCTELVVSLTFLFYPCGWVLAVNSLVYREFLVCLAGSLDGDREMHRIPHAELLYAKPTDREIGQARARAHRSCRQSLGTWKAGPSGMTGQPCRQAGSDETLFKARPFELLTVPEQLMLDSVTTSPHRFHL